MAKYKIYNRYDGSKIVFEGDSLAGANLRKADLRWANLQKADLRGADLRGANLDFSCWPLHCGSFGARLDIEQKKQLLIHVLKLGGDPLPAELKTMLVAFCKDSSLLERHNIPLEIAAT